MADEPVVSFTPEVGGTICSDRQASGRQIPLRRFIVPFALIKHYVPGSLRRRSMRFTDEQSLGAMPLVQVLLRTRIAPRSHHRVRRMPQPCRRPPFSMYCYDASYAVEGAPIAQLRP